MSTPSQPDRIVAIDRDEDEPCERSTPGCCINHTAEVKAGYPGGLNGECETW